MTHKLAELLAKVTRGCGESSLAELFDVFDLSKSESTLSKVSIVAVEIERLRLKLIPGVSQGELDSNRRIAFADEGSVTSDTVKSELADRESDGLELKSSLFYDHKKAQLQPPVPRAALKSEEVLHSSLKTIAAFLTSGGGKLYIGIDDQSNVVGIEPDFACMTDKPERQNADGWELMLRNNIQGRFKDGDTVNDYVTCSIVELDHHPVARLSVSPRKTLSFLKHKDGFFLYRRQGNQTVHVGIDQVEEFISLRRAQH